MHSLCGIDGHNPLSSPRQPLEGALYPWSPVLVPLRGNNGPVVYPHSSIVLDESICEIALGHL